MSETDIVVSREGGMVCISWDHGFRLKFAPRVARDIAADLDRIAVEIAQEVLE